MKATVSRKSKARSGGKTRPRASAPPVLVWSARAQARAEETAERLCSLVNDLAAAVGPLLRLLKLHAPPASGDRPRAENS